MFLRTVNDLFISMKILKGIMRLLRLFILVAFALSGIGIGGVIFPNHREKYENNRIRIELVDETDDERETFEDENKRNE